MKTPKILIILLSLFLFSCGPSHNNPKIITKSEADTFMRERMSDINQTLMKSKVVVFEGVELYYYLSVTENGMTCISAVSENKLEIIASNCGETFTKLDQWNALH